MGIMIFMLKSQRRAFRWPNNLCARLYILYQGSPTFCGRWAKNGKIINLFLLRAINSYFFSHFFQLFLMTFFFAPQNLKRAIIFLKRATFGPRAIDWRPLYYML